MRLFTNGLIVDGSGSPPYIGDLSIAEDRIDSVGPAAPVADCERIDCTGLAIAPGFIDLHSHSDLQVLESRMEKVKQGVTSEVVGNCGFSPYPHTGHPETLREFGSGILGRGEHWGWPTAAAYLTFLESSHSNVNVHSLIGHGSLRIAVAGLRQSPLSAVELDRMTGMLADALDAGCAGFSTGLMYAPGSSAGPDELVPLCRTVARKGKLYATHMRSYSAGLVDAVREQLDLARAAGCRLQISHLQAAGRANWGLQEQALELIESACKEGIDVEFDIYPYQCGSTVLTQWLPQWVLDGGTAAMLERLVNPEIRRGIVDEMVQSRAQLWTDITISGIGSTANAGLVGKNLEDVAAEKGSDPAAAALDLLIEEHGDVNVISFNQSEPNLRQLLTHPLCSVISDGFYVNGKPHPRLHGTFPELLGSVSRERGWMPLEQAVHKVTAKPAGRLRLKDRGLLAPGYFADLTIFDPATVAGRATYDAPETDPSGIVTVIKNGKVVFETGRSSTV